MPDQVCDILNRLIRFYQQYQKESSAAISTNTSDIDALNTSLSNIVIPEVYNGQLTIQKNGQAVGTFTANQQTNSTADITVNNGTLTIQKNGTNVATFTADQSGNSTANITVPVITMTTTDPGEGSALAANNFIAVYQ